MGKSNPVNDMQPDLDMMQNPDKWPLWPRLPLKRRRNGGRSEFGIMIPDPSEPKPTVYLCDLFSEITDSTPKKQYPDFAAAIMDGWRVD